MKRISVTFLYASVLGLVFHTESAGATETRTEACKQEIVEACPGIKISSGFLGRCIKKSIEKFSPECRTIVRRQLPEKCVEDATSICPGIAVKDSRFAPCMRANIESFSASCRNQMNSWYIVSEAWRAKARAACSTEESKCPGVSQSRRSWWTCLSTHQNELSPSCQAFVRSSKASD